MDYIESGIKTKDMSFKEQVDWISKNPDHPLIKELVEASSTTEGDIRNGIQLSLGIVVGYLSKLPQPDMPSFNDLNQG